MNAGKDQERYFNRGYLGTLVEGVFSAITVVN